MSDAGMRSIKQSVPIALLRAREAVMAHFRPLLAARGYTEQQWRVMRVLDEFGSIDASQLADKSALLLPSLTRILQTLEEEGAIARIKDAQDKRRTLISLTDKSRDAIAKAAESTQAAYREIEDQFGAENMNQLLDLLDKLAQVKLRK
ncbi:homoprotocatechuate degradation operon regulator, HpaR [Amylibacter kogurei]|uniref:Homoprotocatechuate degradation operon regulator, HpaR n=1 Tax=Paramylibacter kogurei TaxID=1889778 RepID=A0A2G5K9U1_9RHOB|nr:homoprotocatechuate degradation operon regulator HpaR [Amylibacter kogurei]PIB25929.1 homoprotocatechuate degradation operon regulator, HpaR [Amylibacter kogurei]